MAEINVTQDTFEEEVLNSTLPVLVDVWAPWCGPCRMLAPIVAEIAEEYEGRIKVCKINVDEEPGLARQFRVRSIPTLLAFKGGELVNTAVGFQSKEELLALFR